MIGPFVQIVRQIVEALVHAKSAIAKSRERETKRTLLRLFFDLADFEVTVDSFLTNVKRARFHRNHNSLLSAVTNLRSLHSQLEMMIDRFFLVMRSDAGRYLLEVEGYRVGKTLDTAFGMDALLLHEWTWALDRYVAEVTQAVAELPGHLDPSSTLLALDNKDFAFTTGQISWKRAKPLNLSELVIETELWQASFKEVVELYRPLIKAQVSLTDIL